MRIGIVVGEASGDILGSGLMKALQARYPDATFEGIGGERMLAQGFNSFFAQERLAVMGILEPLKRLFELLRIRRTLIEHFIANPPDVFIGIDSPDFNLTIEEKLRAAGIATVHYVSPSVWAWRQKRIVKIGRSVDLMLTLLPFEAKFYEQHNIPVCFVGHPLADELPLEVDVQGSRQKLGITDDRGNDPLVAITNPLAVAKKPLASGNSPLVALMPGSRGGEVKLLGPEFWQTAQWCLNQRPDLRFIVPAANPQRRQQIDEQLRAHPQLPIQVVDGQSHDVMAAADAVVMASGTTTLEAMLLKKPMVVAYKMAWLSFAIISRLVKSKFFSLPNLLADKPLVPEILQKQVTPEVLGGELLKYFDQPEKSMALRQTFYDMHVSLKRDASNRAADAIVDLIESRRT